MGARIFKDNEKYKQTGSESEIYSDFTTSFLPHPNNKQLTRSISIDAVKSSLKNLILTNKYERLRQPDLGGNVRRFLFERFISTTSDEIKDIIKNIVSTYEKRVTLIDVNVTQDEDNNTLYISINFYVNTIESQQQMDLTLYRVR
jgi:phage baseplate assembly protein W